MEWTRRPRESCYPSLGARRNSTPSGESSANILLELGQHAFAIYCVQMHFEPYVLACLELLEIQLTCLVSGTMNRLVEDF
jgi:hypothetical protein